MKAIKDKILKSDFVNWRELEIIQPKGFKELSKPAYQKLRNSIIENNFVDSFKVWENGKTYLLDGVHRCKVLDILDGEGYDIPDKFRADFIECKDKKQAKKMILVYSSRYAKLLEEGLYEFVQDLDWDEIERVIDFADIDIDRFTDGYMRNTEGLTDDDEIPEVSEAITKTGDLWILGQHRVLCGDATKKEDGERLMDGQKMDMLLTDPPYGVDYCSKNEFLNKVDKGNRIQRDIVNDTESAEVTVECWRKYFRNVRLVMMAGANYYINFAGRLFPLLLLLREKEINLPEKQILIWVKNNHVLGRSNYNYKHEFILYGWNGSQGHKHYGGFDTTVWEVDKPLKNDLHPTMKPIELLVKAIKHGTGQGMLVYDGFLGSGSTLIACIKTNRRCFGIEIDEHYVDVIVQRYVDYTGERSLIRNGNEFII